MMDVVFVIDTSGSIRRTRFEEVQLFIRNIIYVSKQLVNILTFNNLTRPVPIILCTNCYQGNGGFRHAYVFLRDNYHNTY